MHNLWLNSSSYEFSSRRCETAFDSSQLLLPELSEEADSEFRGVVSNIVLYLVEDLNPGSNPLMTKE